MKILEYNDVDPYQVLNLTLLAGDFPLTPEYAAHIRRIDPRVFPCFTIHTVNEGEVSGQAGIFRLPMVGTQGREDVGGIWGIVSHPWHRGRGMVSALLDEAHRRMRAEGMRFSILTASRASTVCRLAQKQGYMDMAVWGAAFARWETAHQPTRLRADQVGETAYDLILQVFETAAGGYLGFAWGSTPVSLLRDRVNPGEIYFLFENQQAVGYALASVDRSILSVSSLLLKQGINPAEAVAAVASRCRSAYVQVKISRPVEIASLGQAGYQVVHPGWQAFMFKSLVNDVTVDDARRLFGLGTDRFLISWLDTT